MTTKTELKPCPFCGNPVSLSYDEDLAVVICHGESSCRGSRLATVFPYEHTESAIKAWNTRAPLEAPQVESEPVAYRYKEAHGPHEYPKPWELANVALGLICLENKHLAVERKRKHLAFSEYYLGLEIEPLFNQTPQASVTVLPERVSEEEMRNQPDENIYCRNLGHNRALDAVAKLNATPVPIELLRDVCATGLSYSERQALLDELRELIK